MSCMFVRNFEAIGLVISVLEPENRSKNGFFGAPFWEGSRWSCPKKFWEKKLRLQAQQLHTRPASLA